MRAISFTGKGVAACVDLPVPRMIEGHALVRVRAAGLCHTDIDVLHGRYGEGRFPLVPGHEYAGVVEAVAPDVKGIRIGARVAVDPNISCGTCSACRKGLSNLCRDLRAYGVTDNGGFADYSLVKVGHLHDIGELPFHVAALAEPLACVLNGLSSIGLKSRSSRAERALVFGAGPIGLLLALSLKAEGVKSVTVADINESRLAFAHDLGLEAVYPGSQGLMDRKREFDLVADATGIAQVVEGMIEFTADGGVLMVFGVCGQDTRISIPPFEIFRRQLTIAGSHSLNKNIPEALAILRQDGVAMARLVSHKFSLADIQPYFNKSGGDPKTMKVQFVAD